MGIGLLTQIVLFCFCFVAPYQASGQTSSFRFVSWADTKTALSVLVSLSNQANSLNPNFTIYAGDLCDSGFSVSCMDAWKKAMNGDSDNGMFDKTFPVRGNHDSINAAGWTAYFDLGSTAARVGATHYTELNENLTYSFDYGNSHFVGVDVPGDATGLSMAQVSWIDYDLAEAELRGLTHGFIYFHGPIYCVAEHCSCPTRTCTTASIIATLIDVFNRHPIVSATFHGHEHTYAYVHIDSSRIFEVISSFEEFVTGDAGAGPAGCSKTYRFDYCMDSHGLTTIDVLGGTFTVKFYAEGNTTPSQTLNFTKPHMESPRPPTNLNIIPN
jgi:hypothetical protein